MKMERKKDQIESLFKSKESPFSVKKTWKAGEFRKVVDTFYAWLQERNRPISGEILMEKGKMFYTKIMKKGNFRASVGWMNLKVALEFYC